MLVRSMIAATALLPMAATAQNVRDCEGPVANARNIAFPIAEATRSFANGAITFIMLDTGDEPTCCGYHIMAVLYPPAGSPDYPAQICRLISHRGELGWAGMNLAAASSSYDPSRGLTVEVPVNVMTGPTIQPATLSVTVNQTKGTIAAQ